MRKVLAVSMFASVGVMGFACTNEVGEPIPVGNDTATGSGGASAAASNITAQTASGGTAQATSATGDGTTATSATSAGTPTSDAASTTTATTTTDTSTTTTTGSPSTSTTGSGGTGQTQECTDVPPDDRETCATWAEWGECENPDGWLDAYCDQSCGRCTSQSSSTDTGSGGAGSTTGTTTSTDASTSTTGQLGDDNPYSPIQGGSDGFATRYWDCCKPSCGWEGNANPVVVSCDVNDGNRSANDTQNGCEANGQSGAFTCHSMAPWAYSNVVSYGFAAVNGVGCGTCFQVEFTGSSHNGGADQGSAALAGKTMIIMATNIGGIEQNQFDLLIPGGGVGLLNGCSGQWGVSNDELGAQYGGFLSVCRQANPEDHEASKACVRQKCEDVFGSRGLTELYDGCMWFVDWFEAADNPSIRYQQISCPQELTSVAY